MGRLKSQAKRGRGKGVSFGVPGFENQAAI
jgi:hypothetical protein